MPDSFSKATSIVGERLREERLRLGLSQDQVAQLAGMHVSNYGKLERGIGNPVLHTIVRLATVLGVDTGSLTTGITNADLPEKFEPYSAADFVRERKNRDRTRPQS